VLVVESRGEVLHGRVRVLEELLRSVGFGKGVRV
jgi:hypothetical protein